MSAIRWNALANLAAKAGIRGLVCSPLEITGLAPDTSLEPCNWSHPAFAPARKKPTIKNGPHPKEALDAGANWLVIGRPIYAAENPRAAAEKILASIS